MEPSCLTWACGPWRLGHFRKLDVFQNSRYIGDVNLNLENRHGTNCRADPQATRPPTDPIRRGNTSAW